jgi:hypothetical protein
MMRDYRRCLAEGFVFMQLLGDCECAEYEEDEGYPSEHQMKPFRRAG